MAKLTKAIKLVQGLTDEEKLEFADFFKDEQEEEVKKEVKEEVKVEVKEEKKLEPKEEKKVVEKEDAYLKLFEKMNEQITALTEKVEKSTPFGAKQKQGTGKETGEFDDIFAKLRSQQRS